MSEELERWKARIREERLAYGDTEKGADEKLGGEGFRFFVDAKGVHCCEYHQGGKLQTAVFNPGVKTYPEHSNEYFERIRDLLAAAWPEWEKSVSEALDNLEWQDAAREILSMIRFIDEFLGANPEAQDIARKMFVAGRCWERHQRLKSNKAYRRGVPFLEQDGGKKRTEEPLALKALKGWIAGQKKRKEPRPTLGELVEGLPRYFKRSGKTIKEGFDVLVESADEKGEWKHLSKTVVDTWIREAWNSD